MKKILFLFFLLLSVMALVSCETFGRWFGKGGSVNAPQYALGMTPKVSDKVFEKPASAVAGQEASVNPVKEESAVGKTAEAVEHKTDFSQQDNALIDDLYSKLDELNERVSNIQFAPQPVQMPDGVDMSMYDASLNSVSNRVGNIDKRVSDISEEIGRLNNRIDGLGVSDIPVSSGVDAAEIEKLSTKVDELKSYVDDVVANSGWIVPDNSPKFRKSYLSLSAYGAFGVGGTSKSLHFAGDFAWSYATRPSKISFLIRPGLRLGMVSSYVNSRSSGSASYDRVFRPFYFDLYFNMGVRFNINDNMLIDFYPFGLDWGMASGGNLGNVNYNAMLEFKCYGITIGTGCCVYFASYFQSNGRYGDLMDLISIPIYIGYSFGF